MPIELQDKLYTSAQVADILGVSLRTLYRYMEDGRIQSMRTASGRHRFTKEQIVDFLNAGNYEPEVVRDSHPFVNQPQVMQPQQQPPIPQSQYNAPSNVAPLYDDNFDDEAVNFATPQTSPMADKFGPSPSFDNGYNDQRSGQFGAQPYVGASSGVVNSSDDFSFGKYAEKPAYRPEAEGAFSSFGGDRFSHSQGWNERPVANQNIKPVTAQDKFDAEDDFDFDVKDFGSQVANQPRDRSNINTSPMSQPPYRPMVDTSRDVSTPVAASRPTASSTANRNTYPDQRFSSTPQPSAKPADVYRGTQPQSVPQTDRPYGQSAPIDLPIRFYKSDFNDLIELAKKIKEVAISKDLEYAFTLNAGLSLHFLINPFTILHFYVNPEDIQTWKSELGLNQTRDSSEANAGVLVNTDVVFMPTREIGGFRVVDDKLLLRDLMKSKDEELVKKFRQHLVS